MLLRRLEGSIRGGMYNVIRQRRLSTNIVNVYPVLSTVQVFLLALYAHYLKSAHNNPRIGKQLFSFFYLWGNRFLKRVRELVSITQVASNMAKTEHVKFVFR